MTTPASDDTPDYEAALTALAVLRDQLPKMAIRDPARTDASLGLMYERTLRQIDADIWLHRTATERGVDAPFG